MELQWKSTPCTYLRSCVRQVQNQEQTMELRLTEGMPDIGRILCAWGQVQLRGKEWRTDAISVSGGVNAWVLYAPEDGSEPRCVEGWIPFQAKWALPENSREGVIHADVILRSLDGRTLSPRKMLVRASLALLGEALEPQESAVYAPDELPSEICLLRRSYPVQLLREAGEKLFSLEETLPMPGGVPRKVLICRLTPVLTEQAVTGSRLVLRGQVCGQYVAMGEDERLYGGVLELPFAQFAELDQDHDKEATAAITLALSDAECSLQADGLLVKCSLIAQYGVHDRHLLQLAEDAYSPMRAVTPAVENLQLPVLLDRLSQNMEAEAEMPVQAKSVVDVAFRADHPAQYREDNRLVVELPGTFQTLYYDQDDQLQCACQNWSGRWELPAEADCRFRLGVSQPRQVTAIPMGDRLRLNGGVLLDVQTCADQQIPMVAGLETGESIQPDPKRPSVILRKCGSCSLWELAKGCGSTVEAIEKANQLTGEPPAEQMLLIPVL